MRCRCLFAATVLITWPGPVTAAAAQCATPQGTYTQPVGWAQKLVSPDRIWPLTDGSGQLVAVIATGVDAESLAPGQVVAGSDGTDCDGRGTFAAGIVAAKPDPSTTFTGIAPGARILGLRYTESGVTKDPDPDAMASAIDRAANAGASVILVAVPAVRSNPALVSAVRDALSRDVVVVSPATGGNKSGVRSYPASLPGVIAVGAHGPDRAAVQEESGDHITLAAPGADLVSTSAGSGHRWGVGDPAFSAAYVAGTVALLRAYRPALEPSQVLDRLVRTANRPASGDRDDKLGWGVLDAYSAVTAELPPSSARAAEQVDVRPVTEPVEPSEGQGLAGLLALLGVGAAGLSLVVLMVVRHGRARGWTR